MVNFLLFLLAGVGMTNLLVNSSIFAGLRDIISKIGFLGALISCMTCTGFWVGMSIAFMTGFNPLLAGAAISCLSYLFEVVTEFLDAMTVAYSNMAESIYNEDEDEGK